MLSRILYMHQSHPWPAQQDSFFPLECTQTQKKKRKRSRRNARHTICLPMLRFSLGSESATSFRSCNLWMALIHPSLQFLSLHHLGQHPLLCRRVQAGGLGLPRCSGKSQRAAARRSPEYFQNYNVRFDLYINEKYHGPQKNLVLPSMLYLTITLTSWVNIRSSLTPSEYFMTLYQTFSTNYTRQTV